MLYQTQSDDHHDRNKYFMQIMHWPCKQIS